MIVTTANNMIEAPIGDSDGTEKNIFEKKFPPPVTTSRMRAPASNRVRTTSRAATSATSMAGSCSTSRSA